MVAPSHEQPGSAHGPEPSTWQCMLSMCPHAHTPRICSEAEPIAMASGIASAMPGAGSMLTGT